MKIIGDVKHANKFCVETSDRGIEWVPNFEIAQQYVNDPKNKSWYNKTIIASYEQVVKGDDGKYYFKSQAPKKTIEQEFQDNLALFKSQSKRKIKITLQQYAESKGFDCFDELISFTSSSLKKYKTLAKEALKYRDIIYSYTDKFFEKLDTKEIQESKDIANIYDDYLQNFPFM